MAKDDDGMLASREDAHPLPRIVAGVGGRAREWICVLGAVALSLLMYVALGQRVLHGDGAEFLWRAHTGAIDHANHLAYVPLLRVASGALSHVGLTMFEAARLCSALGAAAGVGLVYLSVRWMGASAPHAGLVALLVATTPSLVYFATVVEVHAPHFALLALAWVATARLGRTMRASAGAWLGGACALAYCGHASALILPAPALLVAWHAASPCRRRPARVLRAIVACLAVHVTLVTLLPLCLQAIGYAANPAAAARALVQWGSEGEDHVRRAGLVLWHEWLWPYAPVSLLWLRAWARTRAAAWVATLAVLPYLSVSIALLTIEHEFGAYQHAVAWLFACLVVRTWSPRVVVAAAGVALALAVGVIRGHDDVARVPEFHAGLRALAGDRRPLHLAAGRDDLEAYFVGQPDLAFEYLATASYGDAAQVAASLGRLDGKLAAHWAAGGRVFVSRAGLEWLGLAAHLPAYPGFARLCAHLLARCNHRPVAARGFVGWELTARE